MKNLVFVLGAGCSIASGVPAMATFVDEMWEYYRQTGKYGDLLGMIRDVMRAGVVHDIDAVNLESLFQCFHLYQSYEELSIGRKKRSKAVSTFVEAVLEFLEERQHLRYTYDENTFYRHYFGLPGDYDNFATLIAQLTQTHRVTIVSFNYDTCLEHAFARRGVLYRYPHDRRQIETQVDIVKLHGSVNWGKTGSRLFTVYPEDVFETQDGHHWDDIISFSEQRAVVKYGRLLADQGAKARCIAPPLFAKKVGSTPYTQHWRLAADAISTADEYYVIGYSFPSTDASYLFFSALAFGNGQRLFRYWMFNPSTEPAERVKETLADYGRKRFIHFPLTFYHATELLRYVLTGSRTLTQQVDQMKSEGSLPHDWKTS